MLALVFVTTKPKDYVAPFEVILCHLAIRHHLAYASEFITSATPYRYAFVLNDALSHTAIHSHAETHQVEAFSQRVLAFADDVSRTLPLSIALIFDAMIEDYAPSPSLQFHYPHDSTHTKAHHTSAPNALASSLISMLASSSSGATGATSTSTPQVIAPITDVLALMQGFSANEESFPSLCKQFFSSIDIAPSLALDPLASNSLESINILPTITASLLRLYFSKLLSLLQTCPIILKTSRGLYECNLTPLASSEMMFFEISAMQTFLRIDSAQISALASVEKPSMNLCIKDVFKEELGLKSVEIPCLLAFDAMLLLFGIIAREQDIEYMFIRPINKAYTSMPLLSYMPTTFTFPNKRIVCGQGGIYLEDTKSTDDLFSIIARHYPISSEDMSHLRPLARHHALLMFVCYLSMNHPSALWIYDGTEAKSALPIRFYDDERWLLHKLASEYKGADRLLANYQAHFGAFEIDPLAPLSALEGIQESYNLIDICAPIARVTHMCKRHASRQEAVLACMEYARCCLRDKGPRIDYKLKKTANGTLELDYPRILRSCMSFALAGVEHEMIAFGVLDSCAEFVGNFVRDMAQNYAIRHIFVLGDMLTHKIFFDKLLLYLPKDISLILPEDGYIDTIANI